MDLVTQKEMEKQQEEINNFNNIREALLLANPNTQALFAHFFNEGVKSGINHSKPSEKTMEEITNIKVHLTKVDGKIDNIHTIVQAVGDKITEHIDKEDEFIRSADIKYASKDKVENLYSIVKWAAGILAVAISAFVVAALNHVFK